MFSHRVDTSRVIPIRQQPERDLSIASPRFPKITGEACSGRARQIVLGFLIVISCSFFTPLAHATPLSSGEIKTLLDLIREKRAAAPQLQADFVEVKKVHLLNNPITSSGKVWFQAPNKFRREVKGTSPSTTVSDGQELWIYYPNFKSAERYSLGKRSPLSAAIAGLTAGLNLENVEATYNLSALKRDGGGYELQLTPRAPSMKKFLQRFTIWLNDDLGVERTEMLQPNGDRIETRYSNETRVPIPASTFQFTPPEGTEISTPLGK